jgi:hypothetical protein
MHGACAREIQNPASTEKSAPTLHPGRRQHGVTSAYEPLLTTTFEPRSTRPDTLDLAGKKPTKSEVYAEGRRRAGKRVRIRNQSVKRKRKAKDPDRAVRKRVMGKT